MGNNKLRSSSSSPLPMSNNKRKMAKLGEKLQRSFSMVMPGNKSTAVPVDVKQGHFAVKAMDGTRFVVSLTFLANPTFRKLLEMSADEYGFDRCGALTLPCRPEDLQRILANHGDYDSSFSSSPSSSSSWQTCHYNNNNNGYLVKS